MLQALGNLCATVLSPGMLLSAWKADTPAPVLAYRPFYEPLPIDDYWMWFVIPLVVVTCLIYKAVKNDDLRKLPRQTLFLSAQVLVFMGLAAVGLWLITQLL